MNSFEANADQSTSIDSQVEVSWSRERTRGELLDFISRRESALDGYSDDLL